MSCSGCVFMCVGMDVEETGAGHMEAAEEAPAPKRSRGRPRKQPQKSDEILAPRRPRGRPRGSKNKDQRVTTKIEAPKEKKPRGRPRKWPQKTINQEEQQPSHPEVEGAESTEDLPTQTPPSELHQQDSG
ncbi:high mobility group protein HMGI-C-like isoform X1 [Xyrauchen texanus]|uniref:high mobility group protein HMGI-C-like isoform X1 n=1 Tax=Xyrauchen texanus TaxID=154827 RepID=UPI0022418837|nr:high mobility group protein HMGI-C-like isoform X1 [Xyrauchen texanus]